MNVRLILVVAVALVASPLWAQERGGPAGELKTLREKASYSFGMSMGATLKKQGIDIDVALLVQGIRDATAGKTLLTEDQALEAMQAFEKEMVAKQAEESKRFLAENKRRPGIKTTTSGLQYKVLKPGQGPRPKASDVVRVNYSASFINGAEFESNGETPFTTPVNQVIPGWQEALQLMEVGSKWQVFIPPDLAYGVQGSPPAIGPNTALVFELELLEIAKPAAGATRKTVPPKVR
jgi:FKBP-type peptidyl-prolyl cis-trans isomerase FklB